MTGDELERFVAKVAVPADLAECWLWTGAKMADGYGHMQAEGGFRRAHRLSYEHFVGPIPAGLVIDHLCRTPLCVNPTHLEPVTRRENVLRGETLPAKNVLKTHCPYGHPLSGANLYIERPNGKRHCRTCRNARAA